MSIIQDGTSVNLERSLDLRLKRQHLLSANIANADTPGYQPLDLEFEGALKGAVAAEGQTPLATSGGESIGAAPRMATEADPRILERPDVTDTLDHNGVDMDREMARSTDNSMRYRATVEMARRRYAIIRQAISDMARS